MAAKEQFVPLPQDADQNDQYTTQKTVFKTKLKKVIPILVGFAVSLTILAFLSLFIRFIIEEYIINGKKALWSDFGFLLDFLINSLTILLFALPLALPITLALIYVQKGNYAIRFRRYLQYQVVVNIVAGIMAIIAAVVAKTWFITIFQILYINVVLGILSAIALCVAMAKTEIYSLTKDRQPILTKRLISNVECQAVYQLVVLFVLIYLGPQIWEIDDGRWGQPNRDFGSTHMTIVFNAFALMCIFNQLNARKIYGERNIFQNIHKDVVFALIWVIELVLQVFIIEFECEWLDIAPHGITCSQWLWCVAVGLGTLLWQQIISTVPWKKE